MNARLIDREILNFKKEVGVDKKEYQADMDPYPDEEEMEGMRLDNKI